MAIDDFLNARGSEWAQISKLEKAKIEDLRKLMASVVGNVFAEKLDFIEYTTRVNGDKTEILGKVPKENDAGEIEGYVFFSSSSDARQKLYETMKLYENQNMRIMSYNQLEPHGFRWMGFIESKKPKQEGGLK